MRAGPAEGLGPQEASLVEQQVGRAGAPERVDLILEGASLVSGAVMMSTAPASSGVGFRCRPQLGGCEERDWVGRQERPLGLGPWK